MIEDQVRAIVLDFRDAYQTVLGRVYVTDEMKQRSVEEAVAALMRLVEPVEAHCWHCGVIFRPTDHSAEVGNMVPPETGVSLGMQIEALGDAVGLSEVGGEHLTRDLQAALATLRWVQGLKGKEK